MVVALSEKPVVGAGGGVYVAPAGTAIPTSFTSLETDPFTYCGLISEDGLTWKPPEEQTEEINVWQLQFPWDVVTTGVSSEFGFTLAQWNRDNVSFALGGGTYTENATDSTVTYNPPTVGGAADERLVVLRVKTSSGNEIGVIYPRAKVTGREDVKFGKGEMSGLGVTVTMLGDEEAAPYHLLFTSTGLPVVP